MKFLLDKNFMALTFVVLVTIGFFIAGLLQILDYFIVKVILFASFGILFFIAFLSAIKSYRKKNRLEDKPQDDSH